MSSESPLADLVDRIRLGERSAEDDLVRQFQGPVRSMVQARTGDRDAAQDLTQEIMLSVLCALREGRLRDRNGLVGYICGTMRNRVKYHFRCSRLDQATNPQPEAASSQPDPEEVRATAERRELVDEVIGRLNVDDRKILRLTLVEGLSPIQIGKRLGLKSEVVRKRKSRAVQRARELLRQGLSRS